MPKKFIIIAIILLISFAFAARSSAIILENMPTDSHSVQPVPASIVSSMPKNFDISVYDANVAARNFSNAVATNTPSASNPQANTNQTNPENPAVHSNSIWYWLAALLFIATFGILFWNIKKEQ